MAIQCPVCRQLMYEDSQSDGVFVCCSNCNHRQLNFPRPIREVRDDKIKAFSTTPPQPIAPLV